MEQLRQKYGDQVEVICSNSIDYAGLRSPQGRLLKRSSPLYQEYRRLKIKRIALDYQYLDDEEEFKKCCQRVLQWCQDLSLPIKLEEIKVYMENGLNLNHWLKSIMDGNVAFRSHLIHSTYLPYSMVLYALLIARKMQIPSVCTPFYHIYNPRYQNPKLTKVLRHYDALIACTEVEKCELVKSGCESSKIHVVPMGVDYNLYSRVVKSNSGRFKSFRASFGITNPFILYVGFKNREKGALSLLKAAKLVYQDYPALNYVFIGPTTQAFDIELKKKRDLGIPILNLTPSNMRGYFDWRKVSAFQECEIFVMPSRSDAYGMVYLEAWAAGKPVIATRNSVMKEVIREHNDGLLVTFDDHREIAQAIIRLIRDQELRQTMGENGRKKVKKKNKWSLITQATRSIYDSLI